MDGFENIKINVPDGALSIMSALSDYGFESFVVGGCVRDAILGLIPNDWDICTDATPEEMISCFESDTKIIETGLKHGTITIVLDDGQYEITTYRIDGLYSDNRRPDDVIFVKSVIEDLSRRDFTINAMAYNPSVGIIDYFDGINDLKNKTIRCVGNPSDRFREDGLRILRAIRFSSTLGFDIETQTVKSIFENYHLLCNVSMERINSEFSKTILGIGVKKALLNFREIISYFIPEISATFNFKQSNPYHHLDVWEHIVESISNAPETLPLRLTMFFHDIAKPHCYTNELGIGHFYCHPEFSSGFAIEIMKRLKFDNDTLECVSTLVKYHDVEISKSSKSVKKLLNKIGENNLRMLLDVKVADIKSQSEWYKKDRLEHINDIKVILNDVVNTEQCFTLKDLKIGGNDIMSFGIPSGKIVGDILNEILADVIAENIQNDYDELMLKIGEIIESDKTHIW